MNAASPDMRPEPAAQVVHLLRERPAPRPAMAQGYSRFVYLGKYTLWALAAVILAIIVWIASDTGDGSRLVFSGSGSKSDNTQNVMKKPFFQGFDSRNRPYTLTGDQGVQIDAQHIAMENVQAEMTMTSGAWVNVMSKKAHMDTQTKQVELTGGVDVFYEGGYEFRSDHAHVDIPEGNAYGDSPVEGQGPAGTLQANSFEMYDHGKRMVFKGSVRMKLYR